MATQKVPIGLEEPVILSVVGHYKKDADGISILDNLLTEQIKELVPHATIIHLVLEDQETIIADGQDAKFVGFSRPRGYPDNATPAKEWINFYFNTFYQHLIKYRVSHIIAHAPEFIWGAINIKAEFFPEAAMIMMIHEQIEMNFMSTAGSQPGKDLEQWSKFAEVMVSLGRRTYDDVENMMFSLEKTFDCDRKLRYLPSPPNRFRTHGPWQKPPDSLSPCIVILAGDIITQKKQKMILPTIVRSIRSVAQDLNRLGLVKKLAVRITGVPRGEAVKVKETLKEYMNPYITVECVEAFTFQELEQEIKRSYMCIVPLGCSTEAYGLDFMVPAGFGAPTLVPDSAWIICDAEEIVSNGDQIHLKEMIVKVMAASSEEDEERAWKDKILKTLIHMPEAQISANAFRQAINRSVVLAKNRQDFINLLKVPPMGINKQWPLRDDLSGNDRLVYEPQSTAVQRPFLVTRPHYYYPGGYQPPSPSFDPEVIKPVTRMSRLLRNWVLIVRSLNISPLVDTMLAQGSISYKVFHEVHRRETVYDRTVAMRSLLNLVRRRGEMGIDQLIKALRDPNVECEILADRLDGKKS